MLAQEWPEIPPNGLGTPSRQRNKLIDKNDTAYASFIVGGVNEDLILAVKASFSYH